jgi:hypothetical protein
MNDNYSLIDSNYSDDNITINYTTIQPTNQNEEFYLTGKIIFIIVFVEIIFFIISHFIWDCCHSCLTECSCIFLRDIWDLIGGLYMSLIGMLFCNCPRMNDYYSNHNDGYCDFDNEFYNSYSDNVCYRNNSYRRGFYQSFRDYCYSLSCLKYIFCNCSCCRKKNINNDIVSEPKWNVVITQPYDKENECTICLQPFDNDDTLVKLKCEHKYHQQCIHNWMQVSAHKDCPLCRNTN